MFARKYYVVWKGNAPGIYDSWEECKAQVEGFQGAAYKSFPTLEEAARAFRNEPEAGRTKGRAIRKPPSKADDEREGPDPLSLSVDAACSGNPGVMEYRGVYTASGEQLFHLGPFNRGTNNIGEFLAIVHALAYLQKNGLSMPVYTDSKTALAWLRQKKAKTKLPPDKSNEYLFELIARAENWLNNNAGPYNVRKWDTERWGEIPADFGRKG